MMRSTTTATANKKQRWATHDLARVALSPKERHDSGAPADQSRTPAHHTATRRACVLSSFFLSSIFLLPFFKKNYKNAYNPRLCHWI